MTKLTLGVAALLSATAGCFPYRSSDVADGASQKLDFAIDSDPTVAQTTAFGVELPVDVTVSRLQGEWTLCIIQKNVSAGLRLQDACGATHSVAVQLDNAECEDGSCDATLDEQESIDRNALVLRVVGHAPGSTMLHVRVSSLNDGTVWDDAWPVTFLPVSRVGFAGDTMHGARYAMLVGASVDWWTVAENVGESGAVTQLAFRNAFTVKTSGAAFTASDAQVSSGTLVASTPGTTTIDTQAAGLEASATLRAIAPGDVVSAAFEALATDPQAGGTASMDLGADPLAGATPATSIQLPSADTYAGASFAVVLTTADGTKALGGAGYATLAPSSLADITYEGGWSEGSLSQPVIALQASGQGATSGTLSIAIGAAHASVPVTVASN